ncbi:MAG: DUF4145 domain-containing protein [Actinomycetota bacterium]|nr:DUF4145 domain-containing protein [Actinomycetota bacterium]
MSTISIKCGNCGEGVAATIVAVSGANGVSTSATVPSGAVKWLQCPNCLDGSVHVVNGATYPVAPSGGTVPNLPADVAQAWREARTTHAVAAYTASEIMCRKILMHLAVDVAHSPTGKTFVDYIDDLDTAGYIGPGLKPAVDKIRQRGNSANHDLPASTEADSLVTLKITEHLLRGIYEIPGL